MQSIVEGSKELSNLYRRVAADDEEALQYDDGEALAAATLNVDYIKSVLDGLVKSDRPYHLRINATEADYLVNNYDQDDVYQYLRLLCAKVDGCEPGTMKARVHARYAQFYSKREHHPYWDSVDTLVHTVCEYGNAVLLGFIGREDLVIDDDYLNNVLIPCRDPGEVGEAAWHDMAVRFVNLMDEEYQRNGNETSVGSPNIRFYDLMIMVLPSFLTDNADDVVFLNSIHDYVMRSEVARARYRPGFLKPELLDMFRSYGASFIDPLFMKMAEDMDSGSDPQQ